MWQLNADMEGVGHGGVSRARKYLIFARKDRILLRSPECLFETITTNIRQMIRTRPRDYLTADRLEIQLDAAEVARIRGIVYRPFEENLSYLLNARETAALATLNSSYRASFRRAPERNPDLCYFLGDNPQWSVQWSAVSQKIPTFRRNAGSGKVWFPAKRRWLTPAEKSLGRHIQTHARFGARKGHSSKTCVFRPGSLHCPCRSDGMWLA